MSLPLSAYLSSVKASNNGYGLLGGCDQPLELVEFFLEARHSLQLGLELTNATLGFSNEVAAADGLRRRHSGAFCSHAREMLRDGFDCGFYQWLGDFRIRGSHLVADRTAGVAECCDTKRCELKALSLVHRSRTQ